MYLRELLACNCGIVSRVTAQGLACGQGSAEALQAGGAFINLVDESQQSSMCVLHELAQGGGKKRHSEDSHAVESLAHLQHVTLDSKCVLRCRHCLRLRCSPPLCPMHSLLASDYVHVAPPPDNPPRSGHRLHLSCPPTPPPPQAVTL